MFLIYSQGNHVPLLLARHWEMPAIISTNITTTFILIPRIVFQFYSPELDTNNADKCELTCTKVKLTIIYDLCGFNWVAYRSTFVNNNIVTRTVKAIYKEHRLKSKWRAKHLSWNQILTLCSTILFGLRWNEIVTLCSIVLSGKSHSFHLRFAIESDSRTPYKQTHYVGLYS